MYYEHEPLTPREEREQAYNKKYPTPSHFPTDLVAANDYLRYRNLSPLLAHALGWYPTRQAGDSYVRIVMPALTTVDDHLYWQARAIDPCAKKRYQSPYGPRLDAVIYCEPRGVERYRHKPLVVVEGPMCALAFAELGYSAVAVMGSRPPWGVIEHVASLARSVSARHVIIVPDRDAEGDGLMLALSLASLDVTVKTMRIPANFGKDVAEMSPATRERFILSWRE